MAGSGGLTIDGDCFTDLGHICDRFAIPSDILFSWLFFTAIVSSTLDVKKFCVSAWPASWVPNLSPCSPSWEMKPLPLMPKSDMN